MLRELGSLSRDTSAGHLLNPRVVVCESVWAKILTGWPRAARCGWEASTFRIPAMPLVTAMPMCCCMPSPTRCLGAAGLPDIGQLFPNTDEENRDRDSADMLQLAYQRVTDAGLRVANLDCVVAAQEPKLSPHKQQICQRIADVLSLSIDQVNIKAKTGEGVGPVGEQLAIEARCVALLDTI